MGLDVRDEPALNARGIRISRASGLERRRQILTAVLRIIIREGVRGVRHRAVAAEANVPLSATTYYFSGLSDLITAAFTYWAEKSAIHSIQFREACYKAVSCVNPDQLSHFHVRKNLAEIISGLTINHVMEQIVWRHDDRILELAFHHEAFRNETLKAVVINQQRAYFRDLEVFHQKIMGADPAADAQISLSIVFRLQHEAIMHGIEDMDKEHIRRTVRRHIFSVFAVDNPKVKTVG